LSHVPFLFALLRHLLPHPFSNQPQGWGCIHCDRPLAVGDWVEVGKGVLVLFPLILVWHDPSYRFNPNKGLKKPA
jgi:hypothetical protein